MCWKGRILRNSSKLNCSSLSVLKYPLYSKCHLSPHKIAGHSFHLENITWLFSANIVNVVTLEKLAEVVFPLCCLKWENITHPELSRITYKSHRAPAPFFICSVWALLARNRYVSVCAHSEMQSEGLVNSTANQLSTYLSCLVQLTLSLPFSTSTFSAQCFPLEGWIRLSAALTLRSRLLEA